MELTLGLLADYANKTSDGKLNILGIFNRIWSAQFPAVHSEMKLVLRFEMHPAELGETKKIRIQLRNDTGRVLMELTGDLNVTPPGDLPPGEMVSVDQILGMNRLSIAAAGRYEFVVLVNGEVKGQVTFSAAQRQSRTEVG
jgi:hypothetical protein